MLNPAQRMRSTAGNYTDQVRGRRPTAATRTRTAPIRRPAAWRRSIDITLTVRSPMSRLRGGDRTGGPRRFRRPASGTSPIWTGRRLTWRRRPRLLPVRHGRLRPGVFDPNGGHPLDQDNVAASPWIDLLAGRGFRPPGQADPLRRRMRPAASPTTSSSSYRARYYPEVCARHGQLYTNALAATRTSSSTGASAVLQSGTAPRARAITRRSSAPGAEQVQIASA